MARVRPLLAEARIDERITEVAHARRDLRLARHRKLPKAPLKLSTSAALMAHEGSLRSCEHLLRPSVTTTTNRSEKSNRMTHGGRPREGVLAMPVSKVLDVTGIGTVLTGVIAQGTLHVGDAIIVIGAEEPLRATVRLIVTDEEPTDWADAGDEVGLVLGAAAEGFSAGMLVTADSAADPLPDTATEPARQRGKVKWFNPSKGIGLLVPNDGGQDVFLHSSSFTSQGAIALHEGQEVEFDAFWSHVGPIAEDVRVLSSDHGSGARGASVSNAAANDRRRAEPTRYNGRDCTLTLTEDSLLIVHKSMRARYKPVPLSRLSDIHFEPATRWTSGILTIAMDGFPLRVPTGTDVGGDPNTIVFKAKSNGTFSRVHAWLRGVIAQNNA